MATEPETPPAPPDPPYRTSYGGPGRPLTAGERYTGPFGVLLADDWLPAGVAYGAGAIDDPRWGRVLTFRIEIKGRAPVPGLWVCFGRRFIETEDWREMRATPRE